MLRNFLSIIDRFGYIQNGGRVYYSRSHPPLLTQMVKDFVDITNNRAFAIEVVDALGREFEYFIATHTVMFNGYRVAMWGDESSGPRPESYREDVETGRSFTDETEREKHYSNLRAAAESGWDFSSRWFINETGGNIGDLTHSKTTSIIPVELNAFLYGNAVIIAEFYGYKGDTAKQAKFTQHAADFLKVRRQSFFTYLLNYSNNQNLLVLGCN